MEGYGLDCPFDLEKHKARFKNYLEVMILEDGTVEYAMPSHQSKAEHLCMDKLRISLSQLLALCPRDRYLDYLNWLLEQCGAIAVWDDCYWGVANDTQKKVLKRLKLHGVYRGPIDKRL